MNTHTQADWYGGKIPWPWNTTKNIPCSFLPKKHNKQKLIPQPRHNPYYIRSFFPHLFIGMSALEVWPWPHENTATLGGDVPVGNSQLKRSSNLEFHGLERLSLKILWWKRCDHKVVARKVKKTIHIYTLHIVWYHSLFPPHLWEFLPESLPSMNDKILQLRCIILFRICSCNTSTNNFKMFTMENSRKITKID